MHYSKHSQKTQSSQTANERQTVIFLISISLLLILSFLILVPKVSSSLFPFKRTLVWNEFIDGVEKNKRIDEQAYWKFREFYSPGYFDFNAQGLNQTKLEGTQKILGATPSNTSGSPILLFHSSKLKSIDYLTSMTALPADLVKAGANVKTLFKDDRSAIYQNGSTITILFLKDISEMRRANGYFEYDGRDKMLVEGKHWLNITVLQRS